MECARLLAPRQWSAPALRHSLPRLTNALQTSGAVGRRQGQRQLAGAAFASLLAGWRSTPLARSAGPWIRLLSALYALLRLPQQAAAAFGGSKQPHSNWFVGSSRRTPSGTPPLPVPLPATECLGIGNDAPIANIGIAAPPQRRRRMRGPNRLRRRAAQIGGAERASGTIYCWLAQFLSACRP